MRPIAVICAMDRELAHLRHALPAAAEESCDGWRVYLTRHGDQPLVLGICGIGMVNAVEGTRAIISRYAPRAVLNYGCAGAHRAELLLGDVIVGTRVVAYDQPRIETLEADPAWLAAARSASKTTARVMFGTVASADLWNRSPATIAAIVAQHDSHCEDMEAAAIGLVCARHAVPFLSIKDISNNELVRPTLDGNAVLGELGVDQVARRAAAFALSVLKVYLTHPVNVSAT